MAKKKAKDAEVEVIVEEKGKEKLNSFTTTTLIMGLLGIILLFLPEESNKLVGYVIGAVLLLAGVFVIIKYFKNEIKNSTLNLISGILYAILGLIIILNPLSIMKLATIIFGIYLIVNGSLKMHVGLLSKDLDDTFWKNKIISGAIIIVFGLILIINPFSGLIITKVAGAFLLIVAIYDIINQYIVK